MRAYVVFHNDGGYFFSRWLREGFRHCFVIVESGAYLVKIDAEQGTPTHDVIGTSYDGAWYVQKYIDMGWTVHVLLADRRMMRLPYAMVGSCVGMVKAILSIDAWWVLTPWQLHRYLEQRVY